MQRCRFWMAMVVVVVVQRNAVAGPVSWAFVGTVSEVEVYQSRFDGAILVGSPLQGTLTFDALAPDVRPGDPHSGVYRIAESWSLSFSIGEFHSENDPYVTEPVLKLTNDYLQVPPGMTPPDTFDLLETVLQFEDMRGAVWFSLIDGTGRMLNGDVLPTIPPEISGLDLAQFGISTSGFSARANLHALTAVPEPATGLLTSLGLFALLGRRRASSGLKSGPA